MKDSGKIICDTEKELTLSPKTALNTTARLVFEYESDVIFKILD